MSQIDRLKMGARRIARRLTARDRTRLARSVATARQAASFGSNVCAILARPSGALPAALGQRLRAPAKSVQVSQWKGLQGHV